MREINIGQWKVSWFDGQNQTDESFSIPGEYIVGRDSALSDVVICDQSVSRRHAKIIVTQHRFEISDLNSTNGTFINGNDVSDGSSHAIVAGDIVCIGDVDLIADFVASNVDNPPEYDQKISDEDDINKDKSYSEQKRFAGIRYFKGKSGAYLTGFASIALFVIVVSIVTHKVVDETVMGVASGAASGLVHEIVDNVSSIKSELSSENNVTKWRGKRVMFSEGLDIQASSGNFLIDVVTGGGLSADYIVTYTAVVEEEVGDEAVRVLITGADVSMADTSGFVSIAQLKDRGAAAEKAQKSIGQTRILSKTDIGY